jgi:hypothetical protein
MGARWHCAAVGGVLTLTACGDAGGAHRVPGPATEYAGVSLERAEELPAPDGAAAGIASGNAALAGTAELSRSCARRLRDPRDGGELLLMHSLITTATAKRGDTTATQLEHATGEYALLSDSQPGRGDSVNLRVDCVSGHAVGWIARSRNAAPRE